MKDLEWVVLRDFLITGDMAKWELYHNLTMDQRSFDAKFPPENVEERVQ